MSIYICLQPFWRAVLLLMEEIQHQLIGSLPHYLQGFLHPRWCRISSINSTAICKVSAATALGFSSPWQAASHVTLILLKPTPQWQARFRRAMAGLRLWLLGRASSSSSTFWALSLLATPGGRAAATFLLSFLQEKKIFMQILIGLSVILPRHFLERQASKGSNLLVSCPCLSPFLFPFPDSFPSHAFPAKTAALKLPFFLGN